ncbi:hypothetical protein VTK56DRAFT_1747 [Thermocarpiscus australiensis]
MYCTIQYPWSEVVPGGMARLRWSRLNRSKERPGVCESQWLQRSDNTVSMKVRPGVCGGVARENGSCVSDYGTRNNKGVIGASCLNSTEDPGLQHHLWCWTPATVWSERRRRRMQASRAALGGSRTEERGPALWTAEPVADINANLDMVRRRGQKRTRPGSQAAMQGQGGPMRRWTVMEGYGLGVAGWRRGWSLGCLGGPGRCGGLWLWTLESVDSRTSPRVQCVQVGFLLCFFASCVFSRQQTNAMADS